MAGAKHTSSFHLNHWWPSLLTRICVTKSQCIESNPQRNNVLDMKSIKQIFVINVSYSLLIEYLNICKVSLDMEILWRHCVYEIIAVIIIDWWVVIFSLNSILMTAHNVHKNYIPECLPISISLDSRGSNVVLRWVGIWEHRKLIILVPASSLRDSCGR